jgi:hypothetical protein
VVLATDQPSQCIKRRQRNDGVRNATKLLGGDGGGMPALTYLAAADIYLCLPKRWVGSDLLENDDQLRDLERIIG